jgi:hypothetical protein
MSAAIPSFRQMQQLRYSPNSFRSDFIFLMRHGMTRPLFVTDLLL